jgi:haloacetate dehalogenase
VSFHHRVHGSGPPLLLIHGLPTNHRLWEPVMERLAARRPPERRTCVAVDLPGFGETPPLPSGLRQPAPILAGLEALRGALGFDAWEVAGHDAGSVVAVHYAAAHPDRVRRLALLAPPIFPELRPPWPFRWLRWPVVGDLLTPLVLPFVWNGGLRSVVEVEGGGAEGSEEGRAVDDIVASFATPFRGWSGARRFLALVRWGDPAEALGRTAALLPAIQAPTLVLRGVRDRAIPEDFLPRAVAALPDAEGHLLDAGHFLPLDVPERVAALLVGME